MTEQSPATGDRKLERAIILALLGEDDQQRCSCAQLATALGAETQAVEHTLGRLLQVGLICRTGEDLWASAAARRMDELGLIGI
jgi:DNA-binding IclR family transcriptional regulator